jgi:choline dehydrogenase-like flavoprotein
MTRRRGASPRTRRALMENNPAGEDAYHGRTGPLPVRQLTDEELTPAQAGFIGAAVARGFKRVRDFNGADQDGVSGHSVNVVDGIRENAAIVFLTAEVRRRPNLRIRGDVTIDRVLFDGTAAAGVVAADGTVYRAGEVILSAGSYGSPAILLRSGVGPADPQAVVDPVGAVMGTSGLRVVDASIIPDTPSTVLNLTVMMLAERIYQRVYQA